MAGDAAYAEELRGWLAKMQASLQSTMDEVTKKLEETNLLANPGKKTEAASTPAEILEIRQKVAREFMDASASDKLTSVLSALQTPSDDEVTRKLEELNDLADQQKTTAPKPFEEKVPFMVNGTPEPVGLPPLPHQEMPKLPDELQNPLVIPGEVKEKAEAKAALPQASAPIDKPEPPGNLPRPPRTSFVGDPIAIQVEEEKEKKDAKELSRILHAPTRGYSGISDDEPKESLLKRCLRRCLCRSRRDWISKKIPKKRVPFAHLKKVHPTKILEYTQEENENIHLGQKLKAMRKLKAIPRRLWDPRLQIMDANGKTYELKDVEDEKGDLWKDEFKSLAFPVKVKWAWLHHSELPKRNWRDTLWWKKMGFLDNLSLRSLSMRVHARMHMIDQQVVLLTQGMIKDTETALTTKTSLLSQTEEVEMEMALDALTDLDDLLVLDFRCGDKFCTIGKVAMAAGIPWDAFLEAYMQGRNSAVNCTSKEGARRELILAAAKGADGLEQLYQQLVHKIDANELLVFKLLLLVFNGITCAAQFVWSDYLVPELNPTTTTPVPTWQQQIAKLAGK